MNRGLVIVQLPIAPFDERMARVMSNSSVAMLFEHSWWTVRVRRRVTGPWEVSFPKLPQAQQGAFLFDLGRL
jgi:hypothetical protein